MKENNEEDNEENNIKLIEENEEIPKTIKKNELIINEKNDKKEDEEENDPLLLDITISNKNDNEEYTPEINYLAQNPFNFFVKTGFGFAIGGIYGGGITGLISSSMFLVTELISSGIGTAILISSLIGFGIYDLYKKAKNEKYKAFLELLKDEKKMKEEREIYKEINNNIKKEISDIFSIDFNLQYNTQIRKDIEKYIDNMMKNKNIKCDELINNDEKKIKNVSNLNIILLWMSGVGKSALINGILKLKHNKAEEQDNFEPMHIEGWTKKYPINEEDTELKKINLWDTEGIELSNDNNNDQNNHLKKVIKHINSHKSIPNEQINCIWFCINGKTLQKSEIKYIKELLKVYKSNFEIPIIFIYTQAYQSESRYIKGIKGKLKDNFFKENENSFHYIDVIAKENKYSSLEEGEEEISEKPKNLDKLIQETFKLSKKGMEVVVNDIINRFCFNLNKEAKTFEKKIYKGKMRLFNKVLKIKKDTIIEIFELTKNDLKLLIQEYFKDIDENLRTNVIHSIDKIITIIEKTIKGKIQNYISDNLNYDYLCELYKDLIISKYNDKKEPKKPLNKFREEINEFIIKPIFYGKKNYSIIEIYDIITNIILEKLLEKYNAYLYSTKEKIKDSMNRILEENYTNFLENTNIKGYSIEKY